MERLAFDQLAELDQRHWWLRGRRAVNLGLLARALERRPENVLDLGCGPGGFLPGLAQLGRKVIAADSDFESLAALAGHPRVQTVAEKLPFVAESFDLVCAFDVVEHLDDDVRALREVHRVLKPRGLVALSVPAYPWLYSNNDRIVMHRRRYTRKRLGAALEESGFEILRNTHTNVLLAPLIVPMALGIRALEAAGLTNTDASKTNLSWPLPRFAHDVLARIFAAELVFTARFDAPFGHSIAAIARKR
ncbi:MAG TPA: methyltransferase domain-containing protein [Planctomycetota bacterium]|nr:methyltransferase domain-containing protein [Planctomycetota bacterium]